KNSGVQFEQKLASNLAATTNPTKISTEPSAVSSKLMAGASTPATSLATVNSADPATKVAPPTVTTEMPITQDRKGALLQLLQRVNQDLGRQLPTAPASTPLTQSAAEKPATSGLAALSPPSLLTQTIAQPFNNLTQLMNFINARPQAE